MAQTQKTRYAILGALTVFPMSGYDIKKWIKDTTGGFWAESSGRVYPVLSEMLREKFVTCNLTQSVGKRCKKTYTITAKGKAVLKAWLAKPPQPPVSRDELRLKLFYGKNLTKAQYLKHTLEQQKNMQQRLKHYLKLQAHIKTAHNDIPDSFYWLLTIKGAIYHTRAELAWCKDIHKIMASKDPASLKKTS